jgi:signal transduction histidine kinase/ActR/RegA family two-component response regulator
MQDIDLNPGPGNSFTEAGEISQREVRRRLIIAIGLPVALLAVLAAVFLGLIGYLRAAAAWVDHSDQVLTESQHLQTLLLDQETGLRGYLLTGDAEFLALYHAASAALDPALARLDQLVADNPAQQQALAGLRAQVAAWERDGQDTLLNPARGAPDLTASIEAGKRQMDAMRANLADFQATEAALRRQRGANVGRAIRVVVFGSIFTSLLLGSALGLLAWRQIQAIARRYGTALADLGRQAAALEQSGARFQALFARAPLGIVIARDDQALAANPASAAILGYADAAELVGMRLSALIAPSARAGPPAGTPATGAGNETIGLRKDGTPFPCFVRSIDIMLPDGEAQVAYITDRSAQHHLEAQIRQMQKLESIGRLAGGIAHDFNNLLTALGGYADLARSALSRDHPAAEDLLHIQEVVGRATALTRQLLAFARKQPLSPQTMNLNELIERMDSLLRRLLGADIDLQTVAARDLALVNADPGQIEQVLINLAVNARDAMPQGGRLTIETANVELDATTAQGHAQVVPGPYVLLAVSDTGTGMSREVQARLFEPFFTTKGAEGTGLGLATSYGIDTQHGGYNWVYSEVGQGSTFKVYLPRVGEHGEAASAEPVADTHLTGTETVLLVEDDAAVLDLATRVVRGAGYTVLAADAADEALRIAREHAAAIDLLVTDVVLPHISGVDMAAQIRALHPHIKTLFISGYADYALVHQGRLETGMAVLPKPFATTSLLRAIRAMLGGGSKA